MEERNQGIGMAILEEAGERSSGERSETERSGGGSTKIARSAVRGVKAPTAVAPDPEVPAQPKASKVHRGVQTEDPQASRCLHGTGATRGAVAP